MNWVCNFLEVSSNKPRRGALRRRKRYVNHAVQPTLHYTVVKTTMDETISAFRCFFSWPINKETTPISVTMFKIF